MSNKKKVVFLDRDGTINIDDGYVHKIEDWKWVAGAVAGMKTLQEAGFTLTIVTNQSGVAQGLYSEEDMHRLHDYMKDELAKEGITIAHVAFCPHAREQTECNCRKPDIGMAKEIEEVVGPIDYANSWTVGDKVKDVTFGQKAGTHTALIRSRYWQEDETKQHPPDMIADSLQEAADTITKQL